MNRYKLVLLSLIVVLFAGYSYLVVTSAPTATSIKLGLGNDFIRLAVSFSFALPLFVSFYFGCLSSILLFKTKFRSFAVAILILTLILLFNSMLGQIRTHFFTAPEMQKNFTIITNYLYTFGHLTAFYLLFSGTRQLLSSGIKRWDITATFLVIILIGAFYALMLFTNPDRIVATVPGALASHYLSDSLIFLTIFLPALMGWFLAILAAFSLIDVFSIPSDPEQGKGSKQILYGLLFIILSSIILQLVLSLGTKRIIDVGLPIVIGILYVFVAALVVGNFLIAAGARKFIKTQ